MAKFTASLAIDLSLLQLDLITAFDSVIKANRSQIVSLDSEGHKQIYHGSFVYQQDKKPPTPQGPG